MYFSLECIIQLHTLTRAGIDGKIGRHQLSGRASELLLLQGSRRLSSDELDQVTAIQTQIRGPIVDRD